MIWRAEDHSNAAIALVLSPQFILENQAGRKWIRAASSPCFQSLRLHAATSQDQKSKDHFRIRWGRRALSFLRNRSLAVIYCVCNGGFVRTTAKSKWQLCPECQVKCGREKKKTSGSVSHLLFLFMYMYVCVAVCVSLGVCGKVAFTLSKFMRLLLECVCHRCVWVNNSDSFIP